MSEQWGARRVRKSLEEYRSLGKRPQRGAGSQVPTMPAVSPPRDSSPHRYRQTTSPDDGGPDTARVMQHLAHLSAAEQPSPALHPGVAHSDPRREFWRSESPPRMVGLPSGAPSMMPPMPHEMMSNFGLSSGSHLMSSGSHLEEEYHMKRVVARGLLERAEHRRQTLVNDYNEIMRLRDEVQTEFTEYGHEVHSKCCELRTALDTRESMLMGSLERMRAVKEKSLNADSVHCRDQLDQLQQLCASLARLMESERDADIFFAKAAMPEMQLRAMIEHSNEWHPDVEVSFGAKLEVGFAVDALRQLDFSFPAEIRSGGSKSSTLPNNFAAPSGVTKSAVMHNLTHLLNQKNAEKASALEREDYLGAASIKKEIEALDEEIRRVSTMPDEDAGLLKQIAALREEKVSAENYLAAAAVKRELAELEASAGIASVPAASPAAGDSPSTPQSPQSPTTPTLRPAATPEPAAAPATPPVAPSTPGQVEATVYCEITFDEDFPAWAPGREGDTGVKTIASNLGCKADCLVVKEAKMTIRSLASVGRVDEAPPGSLILCVEVSCDMVKSVNLMKKLRNMATKAKDGEVYFGETMVYEMTEPIVSAC